MKGGFKESPLHLNAGLGQVVRWDAHAIQARAQRLARLALQVWASPKVSAEVEELLKPPVKGKDTWTILDHPKLVSGPAAKIYRDLRERVMAMNPAITEEFKQLYVVYRAETLFLSVVPLSASLTLYLNLPYPELQDARHICRDVTNVGRWCSGEVEVKVDADSDMTYIMALIGQAFEWQMEDVEVA